MTWSMRSVCERIAFTLRERRSSVATFWASSAPPARRSRPAASISRARPPWPGVPHHGGLCPSLETFIAALLNARNGELRAGARASLPLGSHGCCRQRPDESGRGEHAQNEAPAEPRIHGPAQRSALAVMATIFPGAARSAPRCARAPASASPRRKPKRSRFRRVGRERPIDRPRGPSTSLGDASSRPFGCAKRGATRTVQEDSPGSSRARRNASR